MRIHRFMLGIMLLPGVGAADIVRIDDGSVLRGTVTEVADGKVMLETAFGGTIGIDPARITALETDAARLVELDSGERVVGSFDMDAGGVLVIRPEQGGPRAATPAQLAAIYAPDADPDAPVWSGRLSAGLSGASGNADNQSTQLRADVLRETPDTRLSAFLQQRYAEQSSVETENELILSGRYEWDFSDRSFLFAAGSLETDEFENLDLRTILSGGYGYKFWDRSDSAFSGTIGAGYQQEEFKDGQSTNNALLDLRYEYRRNFGDWMAFYHTLNLQPQVDDPTEDYRLIAEFAADLPISDGGAWLVRLAYRADYNTTRQAGLEDLDSTYSVNMVYKY